MAGKPGSGGPVPKRSDQRRRANKPENEGKTAIVQAPAGPAPEIPPEDPDWHSGAKRWYASLRDSGQAQFYEASDWATAHYIAEAMSRNLNSNKFSAQLFQGIMSGMTELLTTEGSRRRVRMELQREGQVDEDEDASVTALADYKKQLG